jgi:hypothetical protein
MAGPQSATARRIAWVIGVVLTGGAVGCGGAAADPDAPLKTYPEREVLFVDAGDVHRYMDAGNDVVFVDNRNSFSFQQERIAGARLIPTEAMARSVGSLPLNKWIVLYCT